MSLVEELACSCSDGPVGFMSSNFVGEVVDLSPDSDAATILLAAGSRFHKTFNDGGGDGFTP